ncbi:MAG TPA: cyclodeaminase/cyclohydrolase family protein, partial [Trebonia sp.]|nr:cyclodeaminase/cyclohydrolase family protein [Trebonia sp.]
ETIDAFLRQLAARTSVPGGGTVAGLHAAQAAALIAMVARFSDGPQHDADVVGPVLAAADGLIAEALELAEADAQAFEAVTQAYRLPRESQQEGEARSSAIAKALEGAARPPADLLALSARVIGLAEDLLPAANRNLLSDLLAAAASIRAAAEISRVNIEVNVPGIADQAVRGELTAAMGSAAGIIVRTDHLSAGVREILIK